MNFRIFTFIGLLSTTITCYGQSAFVPQAVGESINTTYDEVNPVISPDGKTLYFTRVNHPLNTYGSEDSQDIWYSELKSDGTWDEAKRLDNLNIARYNTVLSVLDSGKTLLLNGIFNRAGTRWKKRGLSFTTQDEGGNWSKPRRMKVYTLSAANSGIKSHATMTSDQQYLLFSLSKSYRGLKSDIYFSKHIRGRLWTNPKKIKALSSKRSDDAPFVAPGNVTVYFSSDRNAKGQFDFFKSTRTSNTMKGWTKPVLLSDTINSAQWEGHLKTNATGSWAYFSSARNTAGGADIYKVKLFEENPFMLVSGTVRHSENKRLLKDKDITLLINGKPADTTYLVSYNKDSATYKLRLPLGHAYSIAASAEHYEAMPLQIDVTDVKEFTQMEKDLIAKPSEYVIVKGRMLSQTHGVIPQSSQAFIRVNNVRADSAVIRQDLGTYEIKLKHGANYRVEVSAKGFKGIPSALNLTAIDEFQEVTHDLMASEEKFAVISGKILDKKTNEAIEAGVPVEIKVEGLKTVWADIDTANAVYTLRLPVGMSYTISASASSYYPYYEVVDLRNESVNVKIYKDLVIVPIEVGQSIRLNNIFFDPGRSVLKSESFAELNRVAEFLNNNQEIKIEIAGHTDNVGKASTNQKLSEARAAAVAKYVVSQGVPASRIVSKGYGLTKPVASNATREGKAQNRRVEFTILEF